MLHSLPPHDGVEAPSLLSLVATVLQSTADANDPVCSDKEVKEWGEIFQSRNPIPLHEFVERVGQYSECPPEVYIASLIYLVRLKETSPVRLVNANVHKLFLIAVVVANKIYDDIPLDNQSFARIGGVPISNLAIMEVQFLEMMRFDLLVRRQTYQEYCLLIDNALERLHVQDAIHPPKPCRSNVSSSCYSSSPPIFQPDSHSTLSSSFYSPPRHQRKETSVCKVRRCHTSSAFFPDWGPRCPSLQSVAG
jgi:hypothetical protein